MTKTISILGSTGSIGRQTLEVAEQLGLTVAAITAHNSVALAEEQARKFRPRQVIMTDEAAARDLKVRLADTKTRVHGGVSALSTAATLPGVDTVVTAVVGMVGLKPTLAAIREGKRIALANKETLVCAGELVMEASRQYGAEIVPVDSEHSAIFQCLQGSKDHGEIKRLVLTCSGGPFFGLSREEVSKKTKADALRHPNWTMGEKITIDCASLMNKGLEFIEAMRLFRVRPEQVSVVIHRQSIIHSMVEFRDGAVLAQMGTPDMRLPIRYALTYPYREKSELPTLDLLSCPPLTFAAPDLEAFPCLKMAMDCARTGGTSCAVLNGANEAAVELFRQERIAFGQIPELVAGALDKIPSRSHPAMEDILDADRSARECVREAAK